MVFLQSGIFQDTIKSKKKTKNVVDPQKKIKGKIVEIKLK